MHEDTSIHTARYSRVLTTIFKTILCIAIGALLLVLFLRLHTSSRTEVPEEFITIGKTTIPVTIADTPATQEQGLSDTESLAKESGKLFIFDSPQQYGFWMKDMNYPIDIIWIDQQQNIVHIEERVESATYPKVFYPQEDALYVLEVNAGFAEKNDITVGQSVVL